MSGALEGPVLVTGGAGFIGAHVTRALLAKGVEVTVFDNLSVGRREAVAPGARLVVGDLCDAEAVQNALTGHRSVLHLAARVAIRSSFDFVVEDTTTNVVGTAVLMRAVLREHAVGRVVAASSMAVYADSAAPVAINEQHATEPVSPYGISKLALERLVHTMSQSAGLSSTVLRFFNTYGPGQALSPYVGAVTIFTHALMRGDTPTIFGDGLQCRDFVHVQDITQGCLLALARHEPGRATLNLGTGVATSIKEVVQAVQAALDRPGPVLHAPAVVGELRYSIADISRARQLLGYTPAHPLASELPPVVRAIAAAASGT